MFVILYKLPKQYDWACDVVVSQFNAVQNGLKNVRRDSWFGKNLILLDCFPN